MSELIWGDVAPESPAGSATSPLPRRIVRGVNYRLLKRLIDVTTAGIGLLMLSPLFLLLAMIIRIESRGPVLFCQTRVGEEGLEFPCWKFRSMHVDAEARKQQLRDQNEQCDGPTFKIRADPRITRVGRIIRRASLDELPQLWNVLIGDMSLVGPRPAVPEEVAHYTGYERQRLAVTPGITCLWQVSGRSELPFSEQVKLDVEYIMRRSLKTDIQILLRTIPAVLSARGAY